MILLVGLFCIAGYTSAGSTSATTQAATVPSLTPIPTTTLSTTPVQKTQTSSINVPLPTENYETGLTPKTFPYILRGQPDTINLNLYSGVYNQISSETPPAACYRDNYNTSPCSRDELQQYYLKYINEPDQEKGLDNLVNSIKVKTPIQDDQARIAISLVQQIPYDYNKLYGGGRGNARYPYDVLYDDKGICEEKSLLLTYLLRGLGYGVVLFEYPTENHMAVGIKSPAAYAYKNTEYAFVETTIPTIVTDDQENYKGIGKLREFPNIYTVSDGISFNSVSVEFHDANELIQLETLVNSSGGSLDEDHYDALMLLVQSYGLKISNY